MLSTELLNENRTIYNDLYDQSLSSLKQISQMDILKIATSNGVAIEILWFLINLVLEKSLKIILLSWISCSLKN